MSTYNCKREYLIEAIQSILNQTFKNLELIIIDDHSSDYKVKDAIISIQDDRIRVYRNSINLGLTKSLNIGVKVANADIIARMDADDISEKYRLQIQYKFLKDNLMYSLVGSDAKIINNSGRVVRIKTRLHTHEGVCFYAFINNPFMHSSAMFYKDCFYDVGGYNENFRYAQDYDLWCRFLDKYRGVNIPKALVRWRDNNNGISSKKCGEQIKCANEIVLNHFRRTFPELADVPSAMLLAIRHNRFNRNIISITDRIVRVMYEKFTCEYSKKWYGNYLARTKGFR
jgi:glycosyltransferase involved in cell wall biosynthesis